MNLHQQSSKRTYSNKRIYVVAQLSLLMRDSLREQTGRTLNDHDIDIINQMAEDVAFNLPENVTVNRLHSFDLEDIIRQVRPRPSRLKRWFKTYKKGCAELKEPWFSVTIVIISLTAAIALLTEIYLG